MELSLKEDNNTRLAYERWYAKQPTTNCRRCDRTFPNNNGGRTEYCSHECEIGWFPAGEPTRKVEHQRPRHYKKGKHLPVSSYQSKWS